MCVLSVYAECVTSALICTSLICGCNFGIRMSRDENVTFVMYKLISAKDTYYNLSF